MNTFFGRSDLPLWVRWQDGLITAGQGMPETGTLVEYLDPTPLDVGTVSIGTWFNCHGDWEIDSNLGKMTVFRCIKVCISCIIRHTSKGYWSL